MCHLGVGVGVWVGCVAIDFVLVSKGGAATSEEGGAKTSYTMEQHR